MAKQLLYGDPVELNNLADALRNKLGTTQRYTIDEMIQAVNDITVGSSSANPVLQTKTVSASTSAQVDVTPDAGYDGLSKVTVNKVNLQTKTTSASTSAQVDVTPDAGYTGLSKVTVNKINLQTKTVSPTTSQQDVSPDTGYTGLSKVTVSAMTTATQATPSITVSTGGLITASSTQTTGYVTGGTKSATKQLTTKAATTITPSTTDQTIATGTYLTGTVTVKGDSNLVGANILKGKTIFNTAGEVEFQAYYTGSSVPSNSFGNDGDIYFKVG